MEYLTSFKKNHTTYDLYLNLVTDRFHVALGGTSTGFRRAVEIEPGVFVFETKPGKFTRIPKTTINQVYSL